MHQFPWKDPLIKLLIDLDEKCTESKEAYSKENFHLLFDQLTEEYHVDIVLAGQIKHQIIRGAKKYKAASLADLLPEIRKAFILYQENVSAVSIKYIFLSSLSAYVKDKHKINACVLDRGAFKTLDAEEAVGLFAAQDLFQNTLYVENKKKQIDYGRAKERLPAYLNSPPDMITDTFDNIVIESVLFEAQADASKNLKKVFGHVSNQSALLKEHPNVYVELTGYSDYIFLNRISVDGITEEICIEALREVCSEGVPIQFDSKNACFNQAFIDQLEIVKNHYGLLKTAPFINPAYVFYAEKQRLKNLSRQHKVSHPDIAQTAEKIQHCMHDLKNTPSTGVSTLSLTQDLIAINQAMARPLEKKNIDRLMKRANIHKNSSDKRRALGVMMLSLGAGLIVLAGCLAAGTFGMGLAGSIALGMAGASVLALGIDFFNRGTKREKLAEKEGGMVQYLRPT